MNCQLLDYKKKVIINESTIRRDLQLEDANDVDCLPNAAIFEPAYTHGRKQKFRKSKKNNTEVPQPSSSTDNVPDENVPTTSNDPLLSDSEIASLKNKVKKLERGNKSRTPGIKRLRKVGSARRVESSDEASLGDQEDASKQGRKLADIDADAKVTLIDETQGRNDDNLMFDTGVLDEQKVEVQKVVSTAKVNTESTTTTIQKAKMIESKKPLKKKDQIMYEQEVALNLQALLQAKLEEEDRLTRQKEEEANIALFESWDNTQAMMDADYQMAQQLQAKEQEQLSIKEKLKLFVQLLEARKKHFA
ncbi:hypothetical protein Tco_0013167 [Tanacetum coccineum]